MAKKKKKEKKKKKDAATGSVVIHGIALSIRADMTLTRPQEIVCQTDDVVFWSVTNDFARTVNIKVQKFKFRKGLGPFGKVIKFTKDDNIDVIPTTTGTIEGTVVHSVKKGDDPHLLKYSIAITDSGPGGDKDIYDPDLEIEPPRGE